MAKLSVDVAKFKSSDVRGIQIHNQREGENHKNENIDADKTHLNYDLHNAENVNYTRAVKDRLEEGYKVDKAIRKDATVMCGIAIQVNKEFFDQLTPEREKEFFQAVYDKVGEKYGKENIISANVHKDEKAPHVQINLVPLTADGRLTAKEIFDRKGLLNLHTDLAKTLQEHSFDIQRGEPSKEKKERLDIHEFKLNEKEKAIAERTAKLENVSITLDKVQEIQRTTKIEKPFIGEKYVKVNPADFDQLTAVAVIGASHKEEVARLREEVRQLPELRKDIRDLTAKNRELTKEVVTLKKALDSPTVRYAIEMDKEKEKYAQERAQQAEQAEKIRKAQVAEQARLAKEQAKAQAEQVKQAEQAKKAQQVDLDMRQNETYKWLYKKLDAKYKAEGMTDQKEIDVRIAINMSHNFARKNIEKAIADNSPKAPDESNKAIAYAREITGNMDKKFTNMKKIREKGNGGGMEIGGSGLNLERVNPIIDGVMNRFLDPKVVGMRANLFRDDDREEYLDMIKQGIDADFN